MRALQLARPFRPKLQAFLASLAIVFVLVTAAHFAHQHDEAADRTGATHHVCGFCVGLGSAADAPREHAVSLSITAFFAIVALTTQVHVGRVVRIAARPRAPPIH